MTSNAVQFRLPLPGADDDWRVDRRTREVGRRGLAEAGAAPWPPPPAGAQDRQEMAAVRRQAA